MAHDLHKPGNMIRTDMALLAAAAFLLGACGDSRAIEPPPNDDGNVDVAIANPGDGDAGPVTPDGSIEKDADCVMDPWSCDPPKEGSCPGVPTEAYACPQNCVWAYELTNDTPAVCAEACNSDSDCSDSQQACAPEGYCLARCSEDFDCMSPFPGGLPRCDVDLGVCTYTEPAP